MPVKKRPKRQKRKLTLSLHARDVSYMKPKRFQDYMTLNEVSREVGRDRTRILQLEREDRIPKAARVKVGTLDVRLWSPAQVDEIREVFSKMKPGRKPKS
jgi:hypothetical protein